MYTIFDKLKPFSWEANGRKITIDKDGMLATDNSGKVLSQVKFDEVNELFIGGYLNSNQSYGVIFRDRNWKNIKDQDITLDQDSHDDMHNIRETKTLIEAFVAHKLGDQFPHNLDSLDLGLDYSFMKKREIRIKNGVISDGKQEIPIDKIDKVVCRATGTINKLAIHVEGEKLSFFQKLFGASNLAVTVNALTVPLLEAIVRRNTGHGIDWSQGNQWDQSNSLYIVKRYLDPAYFFDQGGADPSESWQDQAFRDIAVMTDGYDLVHLWNLK